MREPSSRYDWERLLAHAALLQARVPSAVLVGGTAAALHAGHRVSFDHDHVLSDLSRHFDQANEALESIAGWRTKRRIRGKLLLGEIEEMLRIKTFLTVERNATRDYLDVAALSHHLGSGRSVIALEKMRGLYSEFAGEVGDILVSVVARLATPDPYDLTEVDLTEYKGIVPPWNDWRAVERQCRSLAIGILKRAPRP